MKIDGVICAHRKEDADPDSRPVREIGANAEALQSLQSGAVNVLGGTSWLWCREEFSDSVNVLFVDEAGQIGIIDNTLSGRVPPMPQGPMQIGPSFLCA